MTLLKFPLFTRRLGVRGKIFEAGGATQDGESFPAALTIMTPHYHETDLQVQLAYSAAQAVSIHGGESRQMSIYSRHNARGLEISDGFLAMSAGYFISKIPCQASL
ncbi:hypothetical protein [Gayadomonas joobiniege]|uniref:hypothetical protein n=1 Tax=Gayadomonas joobiniege TaxID=1234606 RepID=UPI00036DF028|nr:hypothetical protein [Gayadomonas joobiniege]